MAAAPKFIVGTIVKLKSGGPDMTVQEICVRYDTKQPNGELWCQWFAGKKLERGQFPVSSLESVPDSQGK